VSVRGVVTVGQECLLDLWGHVDLIDIDHGGKTIRRQVETIWSGISSIRLDGGADEGKRCKTAGLEASKNGEQRWEILSGVELIEPRLKWSIAKSIDRSSVIASSVVRADEWEMLVENGELLLGDHVLDRAERARVSSRHVGRDVCLVGSDPTTASIVVEVLTWIDRLVDVGQQSLVNHVIIGEWCLI